MGPKLVVGICGASCTGKSSIATALQNSASAAVINMDDFFWTTDGPNLEFDEEGNCFCFDDLSAVDWKSLMAAFEKLKVAPNVDVLIVEGILIANYRPLLAELNLVIFLEIDRETLLDRRKLRVYDPPDPPGYFDRHVWPRYLRYRNDLESEGHFANFVVIDSSDKSLQETIDIARTAVLANIS